MHEESELHGNGAAVAGKSGKEGSALGAWLRALEMSDRLGRNPRATLPLVVEERARRESANPALLSREQCLSYADLAARSRHYARWALRHGVDKGDVVCLLMHNCPEYVAIWLGITRVGGIVALLNTNQVGEALTHAIGAAAPKDLIIGADFGAALTPIRHHLSPGLRIWAAGPATPATLSLDEEWDDNRAAEEPLPQAAPTLRDTALYIYTSGTTGRPKAAKVSHYRILQWGYWFAGLMNVAPGDRMYNCLPMYHSTGGVAAIGAMLVGGGSVVLREKFSAREFWDDVNEWDCTLVQYIGELCRYLAEQPPHPLERKHRVRLCCGNGLRPDVWGRFAERFAIPKILEFYAATEGNFSLFNCEGKPGSIGRIPGFLAHRFPVALVKYDDDSGLPARGPDGFCVRCGAGEVGEALGQIPSASGDPGARFEGYTDRDASEAKILRNVFSPGDAWFRTGDLMRKDRAGFFYFVDRVGETFRWKGENVSTVEVAETIMGCPGAGEAVVYGVAVAGAEGRAGMAAVVAGPDLDLAQLRAHLDDGLPEYAVPRFLRLCSRIEATGTFKMSKQQLVRQGFDPSASADAVYFNCRQEGAFIRIDQALFAALQSGGVRV